MEMSHPAATTGAAIASSGSERVPVEGMPDISRIVRQVALGRHHAIDMQCRGRLLHGPHGRLLSAQTVVQGAVSKPRIQCCPDLRTAMADVGRSRLLPTIGRAQRSALRCTAGRRGRVIRNRFRPQSSNDTLDSYSDQPQRAATFAAPIGTTFPPTSQATKNLAHFSSSSLRSSKHVCRS